MRQRVLVVWAVLVCLGALEGRLLTKKSGARKLSVLATGRGGPGTGRKLFSLFSSDEKTRQIQQLKKDVENIEGLIKQYHG